MSEEHERRTAELLTEIRDQLREQLELARRQYERTSKSFDESMDMQRHAMGRFKTISRIVLPLIALCVALIVYLLWRFF